MQTKRSDEKELLDLGPAYYTPEEFAHCQKMLFRVNRLLGFFRDTVKLLKQFAPNATLQDVGCGGGLFLLHLSHHFPDMCLRGTDIAPDAIAEANAALQVWKKKSPAANVSFHLHHDMKHASDILLTTLVCHHLADDALVTFLREIYNTARVAVIINDLQRHTLAERLYGFISPLLFRNRLITHDGLISIRRGFTRAEWTSLLDKAGITQYQIQWRFPFRWRIILWKR